MPSNPVQLSHQTPFSTMIESNIAEDIQAKAMLRLAEFGRGLSLNAENETIQFWQQFVSKFYGTSGRMRLTLIHNLTGDKLVASSLPRYYYKNVEAGVKEMQLILDVPAGPAVTLPLIIEYPNMSIVFTKGSIKATFTHDFKFDLLEIVSQEFTEYIPRPMDEQTNSPMSEVKIEGKKKGGSKKATAPSKKIVPAVPDSAINEYGISPATLQLLEISDMFYKLNELMQASAQTKRGPIETLSSYSQLLREKHTFLKAKQMANSPSLVAASVTPIVATTPIQSNPQIMVANHGPNPSQLRGSASPRAIKRRTSVGISPADSVLRDSPTLDDSLVMVAGGAGTPLSLQTSMVTNLGSSTPATETGLGLNLVGSPVPSPLSAVTSPVFLPSNTANNPAIGNASTTKTAKRIRTASATPTMTTATPYSGKTAAANGATTNRSRKGTGRKDSTAKRKASVADISDTTAAPESAPLGTQDVEAGATPSFSVPTTGISSNGTTIGTIASNGHVVVSHGQASQQQLQTPLQGQGSSLFNASSLKSSVMNGGPLFMEGSTIPSSPMNNHSVVDNQTYLSTGGRVNGAIIADQRTTFQQGGEGSSNYGSSSGQDFSNLGNGGLSLGMIAGFGQDVPLIQTQTQAHVQAQTHSDAQGHAHLPGGLQVVGHNAIQGLGQVHGSLPAGYGPGYGGLTGQSMGVVVNGMVAPMEGMAGVTPNATLLANSGSHSGPG
ncbi:hypothetical protein FBU30_008815 [Linnemannia zychae]|nr:hypothetical protein FBU30_008815 [Linnemannia zychae]